MRVFIEESKNRSDRYEFVRFFKLLVRISVKRVIERERHFSRCSQVPAALRRDKASENLFMFKNSFTEINMVSERS